MTGLYDVLFPDLNIVKPSVNLLNNDIFVTAYLLMDNDIDDVYDILVSVGWDKGSVIKIVYLIKLSKWATGELEWSPKFIDTPVDFEPEMVFKFLIPFGKQDQFKKILKDARGRF